MIDFGTAWVYIQTGFFYSIGIFGAFIIAMLVYQLLDALIARLVPKQEVQVVNVDGEVAQDDLFTEEFGRHLKDGINTFSGTKKEDEEEK